MDIGFYIHSGSKTSFIGVKHKIDSQLTVFNRSWKTYEVVIEKKKTNILKSICWRLPLGSWGGKYEEALVDIEKKSHDNSVKFFYLRSQLFDRRYVGFLRELRRKYQEAKIILEIPTYPYGKELLSSKTMWPWYFKDFVYRQGIRKYIDRIVTYSEDNILFNIPTIKTMNGMDVNSIRLADVSTNDDRIKIIAVAMMQPYHGFERIIRGLASYYANSGKIDIVLDMVGYGPELDYYKSLVDRYGLNERIIFKGKLQGMELDKAYDGCDIAIGSMAGYKIGIEKFSSIKLGEYLAKGLPVVTGANTLIFEKYGDEYNLNFPNDDSDIDICKVIDFYNRIYTGKEKNVVRKEIRGFALRTIDVSITMKSVLDYVGETPQ